jgi:hypothetical protein
MLRHAAPLIVALMEPSPVAALLPFVPVGPPSLPPHAASATRARDAKQGIEDVRFTVGLAG